MAEIVPFQRTREETPFEAWETFAEMARRLRENPELIDNVEYGVAMARARRRWEELFLASDHAA